MGGLDEFVIDLQRKDGYATAKHLDGTVQRIDPEDYQGLNFTHAATPQELYLPKKIAQDITQLRAALNAYYQRYCDPS